MSWDAGGCVFRQSFKEGEQKWKECQTLGRINDLSNVRVEAAEPLDNGLHPELWKANVHNKNKNNNHKSHNNAWDLETWT